MKAKQTKKKVVDLGSLHEQDETLIALKERYFKLYAKEDIGRTKNITEILNKLELVILDRMKTIDNENT